MCAEPVVHFENTGNEHDERDVEREAGGRARAVHRVDLVAITGDGAGCDAGGGLVCGMCRAGVGEVQYRRYILHDVVDDAHGAWWEV